MIDLPAWAQPLFEPHRYKVPYGGRGSSKSWTIATTLSMIAKQPSLLFPDGRKSVRLLCAREWQNSIEESVHHLLASAIQRAGFSSEFDIQQRTIICRANASQFIFSGIAKNVTKIQSMEDIDLCWVEEAQKISKNSWKVLIPTIRKDLSEIWLSFNPDQEDDPTWQQFIVECPPDIWRCLVNWRDNPFFPAVLKKEMEHMYRVDPETAAHVWEGALNTRSEAVIFRGKYHTEIMHPTKDATFEDDRWNGPYYGADWGFSNDPNALTKSWISPKNWPKRILYVEYESFGYGVELDDIAKVWRQDIPSIDDDMPTIPADCSRPETISHVRNHSGWDIIGCEKWPESVEDGITWLRSFDEIVFHPRCEHMIIEARTYKYKVDRITERVLREVVDAHNHGWDSLRYAFDQAIKAQGSIYNVL